MDELNFCPYCDAPQHKVAMFDESFYFCKDCNRFFNLEMKKLQCLKCESDRIEDSDFPAADGDMVFQCKKCKKMFSAKEFLEKVR